MTQAVLRAIQAQLGPEAVVSSRLLPAAEENGASANGRATKAEAPAQAEVSA